MWPREEMELVQMVTHLLIDLEVQRRLQDRDSIVTYKVLMSSARPVSTQWLAYGPVHSSKLNPIWTLLGRNNDEWFENTSATDCWFYPVLDVVCFRLRCSNKFCIIAEGQGPRIVMTQETLALGFCHRHGDFGPKYKNEAKSVPEKLNYFL